MTGVKNLAGSDNSLSMKLRTNKSKANYLTITLLPSDTYKMEFVNVNRNLDRKEIKVYEDVYCDQLQELFTEVTGMYTKL